MQLSLRSARRAVGAAAGAHLLTALLTAVLPTSATAVPAASPVAVIAPVPRPAAHGVWPLQPRPRVVNGFDPPSTPWASGHRGADRAARMGHPGRAALAGRTTFAGRPAGRGVVVVDHGTTRTTYEPV